MARATPPVVATIFPPRAKPRKSGRQCPIIAATPARTPTRSPPSQSPSSAAAAPLAMSSSATAIPNLNPSVRQTLVAPGFPLPSVRMSMPRSKRGSQYPHGMLPRT